MTMVLFHRCSRTLEVLRAPKVEIAMFGDAAARIVYELYVKRHPRFLFVGNKSVGVALLRLPQTFDDYLADKPPVRRARNKALKLGYTFRTFRAIDHVDEIVGINTSSPIRQGMPMHREYVVPDLVRKFCAGVGEIFGVFAADGSLVAYNHDVVCGDVFTGTKMLGDNDHLRNGAMYLLITETIGNRIELRNRLGYPNWYAYDTVWGCTPGLLFFKKRLGFGPYRVKWVWDDSRTPAMNGCGRSLAERVKELKKEIALEGEVSPKGRRLSEFGLIALLGISYIICDPIPGLIDDAVAATISGYHALKRL
ncbi:MAG TPA: hypothetical protein VK463_07440 [Desulfomonilaceae bacterium]|nr:hypothetical protein [Desulfomonilaceae bacterium]